MACDGDVSTCALVSGHLCLSDVWALCAGLYSAPQSGSAVQSQPLWQPLPPRRHQEAYGQQPHQASRRIPIINPNTMEEVEPSSQTTVSQLCQLPTTRLRLY